MNIRESKPCPQKLDVKIKFLFIVYQNTAKYRDSSAPSFLLILSRLVQSVRY